eukprot:TRINITY_DN3611_c0_g1_i6.p1 TRINITY_DN3611_c0_g1~~TRINITY_DN3611_c0_g1_i6.p1  ORF type:complete len:1524 (-),score=306.97 TRINITY_DN3611_c0_g1_i6:45-3983(-)
MSSTSVSLLTDTSLFYLPSPITIGPATIIGGFASSTPSAADIQNRTTVQWYNNAKITFDGSGVSGNVGIYAVTTNEGSMSVARGSVTMQDPLAATGNLTLVDVSSSIILVSSQPSNVQQIQGSGTLFVSAPNALSISGPFSILDAASLVITTGGTIPWTLGSILVGSAARMLVQGRLTCSSVTPLRLQAQGNLTITGTLTVEGGTVFVEGNAISGTGTYTINNGAQFSYSGALNALYMQLNGTLQDGASLSVGSFVWASGIVSVGSVAAVDGSVALGSKCLLSGTRFTAMSSLSFTGSGGSFTLNQGALLTLAASASCNISTNITVAASDSSSLVNRGKVRMLTGILTVTNFQHLGQLELAPMSVLLVTDSGASIAAGASVTGGRIIATSPISIGSNSITSDLQIDGGQVTFSVTNYTSPVALTSGFIMLANVSSLSLASLSWSGGTLTFANTSIAVDQLSVNGGVTFAGPSGSLVSRGQVTLSPGASLSLCTGCSMRVSASASATLGPSVTITGSLFNMGSMLLPVGTVAFRNLDNNGTILFPPSGGSGMTCSGQCSNLVGGRIVGVGSIDVSGGSFNFINAGTIILGLNATSNKRGVLAYGKMTISGAVQLQPSSVLRMAIGGTSSGSQYPYLEITGTANLNGTLSFEFVDGFVPSDGDSFAPVTYTNHRGTFTQVLGPYLPQLGSAYIPFPQYDNNQMTFKRKTCGALLDCFTCQSLTCSWCPGVGMGVCATSPLACSVRTNSSITSLTSSSSASATSAAATSVSSSTSSATSASVSTTTSMVTNFTTGGIRPDNTSTPLGQCTNCTLLSGRGCGACAGDVSCSYCAATQECLFRSSDSSCDKPTRDLATCTPFQPPPPVETPPAQQASNIPLIAGVVAGGGTLIIIAIILAIILLKRRRTNAPVRLTKLPPQTDVELVQVSFPSSVLDKKVSRKDQGRVAFLAAFEQLLVDHNWAVPMALISILPPTEIDRTAQSLIFIFEKNGCTIPLLCRVIDREVEQTLSEGTLFRSNSVASKMLSTYSTMIGMRYVYETVGLVMHELLQATDDGTVTAEVDPDRAVAQGDAPEVTSADLAVNKYALMLYAQKILTAILNNARGVPFEMRVLCRHLRERVTAKYPSALYTCVGGYFFLRFWNVVLLNPQKNGLAKSPPSKQSLRVLILITKTLQNVANNVTFGEKEKFMAQLNDFIATNQAPVRAFFDELCNVDPSAPPPPRSSGVPLSVAASSDPLVLDTNRSSSSSSSSKALSVTGMSSTCPPIPVNVHQLALATVHKQVHNSRAAIRPLLSIEVATRLDTVMQEIGAPLDEE